MNKVFYTTSVLLLTPYIGMAQIRNPLDPRFSSLPLFLEAMLDVIITVSIPIIVVMVIYAGFLFVTAGGNSEKLNQAKKTLLYTLIGALIILGAFVISDAVEGTIADIT